jgi:hypothetical protein
MLIFHSFQFHSSTSRLLGRFCDAVNTELRGEYLGWYNSPQAKQEARSAFCQLSGIPGVLGIVDGTHVRHVNEIYFLAKKSQSSPILKTTL